MVLGWAVGRRTRCLWETPATLLAPNFTTVSVVPHDMDNGEGFDPDAPSSGTPSPETRSHVSGADSPAPIPPHERTWRHPSEIGFATVSAIDTAPINIGRTGRSLIGFVTVSGVVLSIVVVMALRPDSLRSDPRDVVALTNSRLRVASFDYPTNSPDIARGSESPAPIVPEGSTVRPALPIELPSIAIGSRLADTFRSMSEAVSAVTRPTQPAETTTTTVATSAPSIRAMGVLSESGEHLLTTTAAVAGIESIDVRLPDGRMVRGRILHTLTELNIAVLSVSDESTTGSRADIKASGLGTEGMDFVIGQPVIVLVDRPREFVIGSSLDDVVISLESFASTTFDASTVAEGAPLVSKTGHLIGLCTHASGRLGFIPVNLLESALARMLNADVDATTTLPTPAG